MKSPARIQRQRTKGWRMPSGAVYVGRPSRWGNPFRVSDGSCDHPECGPGAHPPLPIDKVLDAYRSWIMGMLHKDPNFLDPLHGRDLACWCRPGSPCHADVLLDILAGTDDVSRNRWQRVLAGATEVFGPVDPAEASHAGVA